MRILAVFIRFFGLANSGFGKIFFRMFASVAAASLICMSVNAAPITLICNGDLNFADHHNGTVESETAILDLENQTFKPPLYAAYPIIRTNDTEVTFGFESKDTSIFGILDRVSGSLSMNTMKPAERAKLKGGASAQIIAWMTAKCALAKRMF